MGKTTYMGNFNCSVWVPENSYSVCLRGLAGGDKAEIKVQLQRRDSLLAFQELTGRTALVPLKDKETEFHECYEALMSFLLRIVNARPGVMLNWLFKFLFFIQEQGIAQNFYILVLVCDTRGGDRCKSSDAFISGMSLFLSGLSQKSPYYRLPLIQTLQLLLCLPVMGLCTHCLV